MFGMVTTMVAPFPTSNNKDLFLISLMQFHLFSYPLECDSLTAPTTSGTSSFARTGSNRRFSGVITSPTLNTLAFAYW